MMNLKESGSERRKGDEFEGAWEFNRPCVRQFALPKQKKNLLLGIA